ncbi:MAG: hypothetical protein QN116_00170 [Armatimonadota bacterium]|nr:hypothetical protein [Armatimonadota bacterium]
MRAAGASLVLGRRFWEELSVLRGTEGSAELLEATRRARLRAVLQQAGYAAGEASVQEVLERVPRGHRSGVQGPILAMRRRTSGSSGKAAEVSVGRGGYAQLLAAFWRALSWWGVEPGAPGLVLLGAQGHTARLWLLRLKDGALGARRVFVRDGTDWLREARALLSRCRFAYVYGYPSALYELAVRGVELRWSPQVVIATGEPPFGFQRRAVQKAFGATLVEEFGCTEIGAVAFECPRGSLHLVAEQVWLEAEPTATLASSLVRRPVPLLRYPLDEPVSEEGGTCTCGRVLPRVVLPRRLSPLWRAFEACTELTAAEAPLPARFVAKFNGAWALRAEEADRPALQALCQAADRLGLQARAAVEERLPRGAAGKFRYLEVST